LLYAARTDCHGELILQRAPMVVALKISSGKILTASQIDYCSLQGGNICSAISFTGPCSAL
jgi:hypothetical protein